MSVSQDKVKSLAFIILLFIAYVGIQYQTFTDINLKMYSLLIIIWYPLLLFIKNKSKCAYQWDFYRNKLKFCQLFVYTSCRISLMISEGINILILGSVLPSPFTLNS